jgi:hypothetical protein
MGRGPTVLIPWAQWLTTPQNMQGNVMTSSVSFGIPFDAGIKHGPRSRVLSPEQIGKVSEQMTSSSDLQAEWQYGEVC